MLWRSFGLRQLDQNNTTRRSQSCPLVCCQAINVAHMQGGVHNEEKSTRELSAALLMLASGSIVATSVPFCLNMASTLHAMAELAP